MYANPFVRNAQRKTRFEGTYKSSGGELIRYTGTIVNIGSGAIWTVQDVKGTLALSGKPAGLSLNTEKFQAPSLDGLRQKLASVLGGLQIWKDEDSLRAEMEADEKARRRGSSYVPGSVKREAAPAPEPKKIFGLDPSDNAGLAKLFDTAFYAWAIENRDTAEFSDKGKTPEEIAQAKRDLEKNIAGMSTLLMEWARKGTITVLSLQEVRDAAAFLKQRGHWFGQRERGKPMASEYVSQPEAESTPEPAEKDPRSMTFEELQQIERERQQRVRREKGLRHDVNNLGKVI
jgi:hypothetical protein